jgi:acetyl-CoA carboxylase biotin carboxyl carrier protein
MKVQEIIDLIDFISKKRLDEVKLETSELKLSIKKNTTPKIIEQQVVATPLAQVAAPPPAPITQVVEPTPTTTTVEKEKTSKYIEIKSPMIGTFYRSSNPETPAFTEIGSKVNKGQAVCVIEAMKLFNEIESEVSGTIVKVLVEDASPVEFDQPLFLVDPS